MDDPWGDHTEEYDKAYSEMTTKYSSDVMEEVERFQVNKVLDIGCGTGAFALLSAAKYNTVATDISPGMIRKVTQKAKELNLPLEAFVCDAQTLDKLQDGSFDAAVSVFALFLVPDKSAALKSAFRVLRQGGILAMVSFNADTDVQNQIVEIATYIQFYMGKDPSKYPDQADIPKNPCMFENTLVELVIETGFFAAQVVKENHDLVFDNGQEAINFFISSPFCIGRIAELGKDKVTDLLVLKFADMGFKDNFWNTPVVLATHALLLLATK